MFMKRSRGIINTLFDAAKPFNNLLTNIVLIILLWVGTTKTKPTEHSKLKLKDRRSY